MSETSMIDRELLAACQRGSDEAFGEIMRRYTPMVYAVAFRSLNDSHLAEDATQATFLVLARKTPVLSPATTLSGWLYMVAQQAARNLWRARERRERHEREAAGMKASASDEQQAAPGQWQEIQGQIDAALAELPGPQREAVLLRCFRGLSPAQAAVELGCSEKALSMRLSRGLDDLRDRLRRRSVTVSSASLLALLSAHGSATDLPASLTIAIQTACLGKAAATTTALTTAEGVIKTMFWMKLKTALTALLAATVIGGGATGIIAVARSADDALPPKPVLQQPDASSDEAKIAKMRTVLANLSTGCAAFEFDNGHCPPDAQGTLRGSASLLYHLTTPFRRNPDVTKKEVLATKDMGPYIDPPDAWIRSADNQKVIVDLWGTELRYVVTGDPAFALWSCGPNKTDDNGKGDDIAVGQPPPPAARKVEPVKNAGPSARPAVAQDLKAPDWQVPSGKALPKSEEGLSLCTGMVYSAGKPGTYSFAQATGLNLPGYRFEVQPADTATFDKFEGKKVEILAKHLHTLEKNPPIEVYQALAIRGAANN